MCREKKKKKRKAEYQKLFFFQEEILSKCLLISDRGRSRSNKKSHHQFGSNCTVTGIQETTEWKFLTVAGICSQTKHH